MPIPRDALRLRPADRAELLANARTAHCATVNAEGVPHVVPLWFIWRDDTLWVNSLRRSRRGHDLERGSPVSVCIDDGVEYGQLRGVTFTGRFEVVEDDATLEPVRRAHGDKYWHGIEVPALRSHRWLRLVVEHEASWDFNRIEEAGGDRRLEAMRDAPREG
jgi:general stress protein 26